MLHFWYLIYTLQGAEDDPGGVSIWKGLASCFRYEGIVMLTVDSG